MVNEAKKKKSSKIRFFIFLKRKNSQLVKMLTAKNVVSFKQDKIDKEFQEEIFF